MPGTEIEVQLTGKQKSKYDKATVFTLADEYGLRPVPMTFSNTFLKLKLKLKNKSRLSNFERPSQI